jgi:hypothetical protein
MKTNPLHNLYGAIFAAVVAGAPVAAQAMGDEEFVGPFASWANVTSYGAVGDGVTDDTAAIQNAISALRPANPTIYFPAGTYLISGTLTLHAQQYVSIIGADPATTTILWNGTSGGTMLLVDGVAYSRIDRLTFNGSGTAGVDVDQSNLSGTGYFDTGNEYADDVFENAGIGYRCGWNANGCAESSMLRGTFANATSAGILLGNFNALDIFVWYSQFENCYDGASNILNGNGAGAGNFHVFNSIFQDSMHADIDIGNTGTFNFRNNYSIESNLFLYAAGTNNPANITLQGNTILDTTQTGSVAVGDLGPLVFLGNVVRSASGKTAGPVVLAQGFTGSFTDLFSMGNTFTVTSPEKDASGHYHTINDQVVARSTVNPTMPTLPGTPPNNNRQIFEASPTGSGTACTASAPCSVQQAITNAAHAEQTGAIRPVAHIAAGTYGITATITVPATVNSGIQIIGDGGYSLLQWTISSAGPVMRLLGPSKVILRDFAVNGEENHANGIELDNADQAGSSVFMEQANLSSSYTNLFIDALDYANVQLHDFYHNYDSTAGAMSVDVTGGPDASQGDWQGGATNIFAGESSGNYIGYNVSNGAHFSVRDTWNDAGSRGNLIANVTGKGAFSYAGSTLYLPSASPLVISLSNFQGTAAFVNLITNGSAKITGNGSNAQVLGLGLVGPSTSFFSNTSKPVAAAEFLNGQTRANPNSGMGASKLPDQGCCDPTFLTETLSQLRTEQPTLLTPLPSGVTDARFYRVFVGSANIGIHVKTASKTTSSRKR